MKKKHNRLVTKIYYDYNNFMKYRGVNFGGKLDYHYKEKLSEINKNIIINYPLNYLTVKIYELGKCKLHKFGGSWAEFIKEEHITKNTTSFELHNVKDYQDLINKLIRFYNIHRKDTHKGVECNRCLTNLERVNESIYKNPKRSGAYPDNNFVLEYYEDI